jgi:hypothetical protein
MFFFMVFGWGGKGYVVFGAETGRGKRGAHVATIGHFTREKVMSSSGVGGTRGAHVAEEDFRTDFYFYFVEIQIFWCIWKFFDGF